MVDVAQLVESRIVIPVVVGSSPIGHPTELPYKKYRKACLHRRAFLLLPQLIAAVIATPRAIIPSRGAPSIDAQCAGLLLQELRRRLNHMRMSDIPALGAASLVILRHLFAYHLQQMRERRVFF